jgi:hypothetical protein
MANPSCLFECQEEKAIGQLHSAHLGQLAPKRLEVFQSQLWQKGCLIGLFIVRDPPEVSCGEQPLHHLIQGDQGKTNRLLWSRRNG